MMSGRLGNYYLWEFGGTAMHTEHEWLVLYFSSSFDTLTYFTLQQDNGQLLEEGILVMAY